MATKVKFHRDALEIPVDPAERTALIKWLMWHPLWFYEEFTGELEPWDEKSNKLPGFIKDGELDQPGVYERTGGGFLECVEINPTFVNPETAMIDDDHSKNTRLDVWLESGGWIDRALRNDDSTLKVTRYDRYEACHDPVLDCGGTTIEEAFLELAVRVKFYYTDAGENRQPQCEPCDGFLFDGVDDEKRDKSHWYFSTCLPDDEGYCRHCGFEYEDGYTRTWQDLRDLEWALAQEFSNADLSDDWEKRRYGEAVKDLAALRDWFNRFKGEDNADE